MGEKEQVCGRSPDERAEAQGIQVPSHPLPKEPQETQEGRCHRSRDEDGTAAERITPKPYVTEEPRVPTEEEKAYDACQVLKTARYEAKTVGKREKAAKEEAEAAVMAQIGKGK